MQLEKLSDINHISNAIGQGNTHGMATQDALPVLWSLMPPHLVKL